MEKEKISENELRKQVLNTISEIQQALQREKELLLAGEISPKISLLICINDDNKYNEMGFAAPAVMFQFIISMISEYPELKNALINLWDDLIPQQKIPVMQINHELN